VHGAGQPFEVGHQQPVRGAVGNVAIAERRFGPDRLYFTVYAMHAMAFGRALTMELSAPHLFANAVVVAVLFSAQFVDPHSLRATTATLLLDSGVAIEAVQDLLERNHITSPQIYDKRRRAVKDVWRAV
jgi:integrase